MLRAGNTGSNTTADHIQVLHDALAQLPEHTTTLDENGRRSVLVRTDAAGATHGFTARVAEQGMQFSATPASKTASARPKTPACVTCPSTTPRKTRYGWKSVHWPPT